MKIKQNIMIEALSIFGAIITWLAIQFIVHTKGFDLFLWFICIEICGVVSLYVIVKFLINKIIK